jgi:ABC-type transporter Mla subunit MlaD
MNSQHSRPGSPGSSSAPSQTGPSSQDVRAKGAEAASKVANAARQASGQAKQAASSLKGFLNMQVGAGADLVDHVVESARAAAESLDQNAPQLAGLVRNAADRSEAFSQDLRQQTVEDLIRMASDFTRKQPALVFGLASLAGFLAFRVIKSSPPESSMEQDPMRERFKGRAGQFHGI